MGGIQQMPTAHQFGLTGALVVAVIASLIASVIIALIVFYVFLFGGFGTTGIRILATALTISGYALTGLVGSVLFDGRKCVAMVFSGMGVSVVGFLFAIGAIWFGVYWVPGAIFAILAFSIAHSSLLLLLAGSGKNLVNYSLNATIAFIAIVALTLIYSVLDGFSNGVDDFLSGYFSFSRCSMSLAPLLLPSYEYSTISWTWYLQAAQERDSKRGINRPTGTFSVFGLEKGVIRSQKQGAVVDSAELRRRRSWEELLDTRPPSAPEIGYNGFNCLEDSDRTPGF